MIDDKIPFDVLVGLYVTDDAMYHRYREAMMPILRAHGGSFRYDFRIGEVLKSETDNRINRLFVISFPDAKTKESFFSNTEYKVARAEFFDPSVESVTPIAEYVRPHM